MHVIAFLGVLMIFALAAIMIVVTLVSHGARMRAALFGQEFGTVNLRPQLRVVHSAEKRHYTVNLHAFPPVSRPGYEARATAEPQLLAA
jgi:hypothetical protein